MTVQTIPDIDEMTPAQQIELMEALWKSMSERNVNHEPPDWHLRYLEEREQAIANGEDSFVNLEEFENDLRSDLK
ncbi:MAG: addiction module protein [Chloracidobacterium sp.]|nr:addiction module protein [Chloracidobacterium sp.]